MFGLRFVIVSALLWTLTACPGEGTTASDTGLAAADAGPSFPVQRKVLHEVFSASNCGPTLRRRSDSARLTAFPTSSPWSIIWSGAIVTSLKRRSPALLFPEGASSYSIPWW